MIYLDANATTPPDPVVEQVHLSALAGRWGNPSASHAGGRKARRALETARAQVAGLAGAASPEEILFTSGATESINTVHHSAWQTLGATRPLLVTTAVEHAATQACADRWRSLGGRVKTVSVTPDGLLDLEALRQALEPGLTALVSVLWANNETGVIQPMKEISAIARHAGALVHADAVQMPGRVAFHAGEAGADYLSLSAHKMHGVKGCGALYVSRQAPFSPFMVGGGQERERRSGTENVPGAVAMGQAAELSAGRVAGGRDDEVASLRDLLENRLREALPDILVHGQHAPRLPNTTSIHFPGVDAAALLIRLDQKGLACSGGSACHTASLHPSHVLEAMGFDARHAASTLRLSLSRLNTAVEMEQAATLISAAVRHLRTEWAPDQMVTVA